MNIGIIMFLEGSETFISAILASRMKIKALNYDADLENIHLKLPVSPFWSLFEFSKKNYFGESIQHIFQTGRMLKTPRIWTYWNEYWSQWNFYQKILKNKKVIPDFLGTCDTGQSHT